MTESERQAAELSCMRLIKAYCSAADLRDADRFTALFTPNARWYRPNGEAVDGHAEIRAYFEARPQRVTSAHVCSNIEVDVIDACLATGRSLSTVYRGERPGREPAPLAPPTAIVENRDRFVYGDCCWHIEERRTTVLFASP